MNPFRRFKTIFSAESLAGEAAGGVVMMAAAALALLLANSPMSDHYQHLTHATLVGHLTVSHFIQDVLMAIFFLLVGLELKYEMLAGSLAAKGQKLLPLIAAAGGVIVPALVYVGITRAHPELTAGWAIPTATDIAFAVCVLRLVGPSIPQSAKMFLLALASYDDLAAILIIAFFYSAGITLAPLGAAFGVSLMMLALNRLGVSRTSPYLLLGAALWWSLQQAGIHPTIAGVVTGMAIPLTGKAGATPLKTLLHPLHPYVAFGILPLFAFASAGVDMRAITADQALGALPIGITLGLFAGKQLGITLATVAGVTLGLAKLPSDVNWRMVYGMALLAGIGFTMSLFLGQLAFTEDALIMQVKLGVLAGSLLSALGGFAVLKVGSRLV